MAGIRDLIDRRGAASKAAGGLDAETLRRILSHIVIPLFVLDSAGKVIFWNEALEKLTGLVASETVGAKSHWRGFYRQERPCLADLVFRGDDADVKKLYAAHESGASSKGRMRAQNWCDLPKGERRYLLIDAGAIFDSAGKIQFVVETLQDQTAIKEAEVAVEEARKAQAREFEQVRDALGAGLGRLAKGDFSRGIDVDLPSGAAALRKDFNVAVESLRGLVSEVGESVQTLDSGASAIVEATRDVTEQSRRQRDDLAEAVRALNRITGTVRDNAAGAETARGLVSGAKAEAEKSGVVVRDAIDAIHEIEKSSKQIGQIIGAIDEIAFQTNLLALNAGVEAARAGESGKGFAVVASEVRALAQRSADAAKQIKQLVATSDAQVSRGVELVSGAGHALRGIAGQVARLNDAVSDIARQAFDQAGALQQVDGQMTGIDKAMAGTTGIVERSASAAQGLADEVARLHDVIGRFRIGAAGAGRLAAE